MIHNYIHTRVSCNTITADFIIIICICLTCCASQQPAGPRCATIFACAWLSRLFTAPCDAQLTRTEYLGIGKSPVGTPAPQTRAAREGSPFEPSLWYLQHLPSPRQTPLLHVSTASEAPDASRYFYSIHNPSFLPNSLRSLPTVTPCPAFFFARIAFHFDAVPPCCRPQSFLPSQVNDHLKSTY
ncbi:hypothetical protein BGX38DRAFT_235712 [Terfezia claveryi]|nr:hypothetical protein BGX38DRAFT_235712 [Terfezia claveryi]